MGKFLARKALKKLKEQSAVSAVNNTNTTEAAANQAAAVKSAEEKALQEASAITSNGRVIPSVSSNTTNQAVSSDADDDLAIYINDMRNRRKKRGAPIGENQGVLGQPTTLGV